MAAAMPTLYWFDRFDDRIGILPVVGELVHTEELNGEDTIEFQTREVPAKGDRLLWRDGGTWREHVVVRTDEPLEGLCSVYAESSLCELLDWTTSSRRSTLCRGRRRRRWPWCWRRRGGRWPLAT
ncbi:MAG: hypothetical protein IKG18_00010 [Atopobiaceae bacterium]|nr:hypothetical protein [Atopobiaceae bacterium]